MSPIFDQDASLRRMGQDEQLFREMIGLISEDAPRLMQDLMRGVEAVNAERVHHAAHMLKGLVANFSAARALEAADKLQRLTASKLNLSDYWPEIRTAANELGNAVEELLHALTPLAIRPNLENRQLSCR